MKMHRTNCIRFPDAAAGSEVSFEAMSDLSAVPVPKGANSFANLLASFTGNSTKSNETWDDSALLDDVTTISYEQALRSHRRVPAAETLTVHETTEIGAIPAAEPVPVAAEKKRKTASITIRLTECEQAQLHERAADAQLSVSAYLRSCIFEAESLRAQVKEALSQMKAEAMRDPQTREDGRPKPPSSWRSRFFPRWSRDRASA